MPWPMTSETRDTIRSVFAEALEMTGLTGGVGFQAAPANFVEVAPGGGDAPPGGDRGVVV